MTQKPISQDPPPIRWPASVLVVAIVAILLATWLPHYVTWPWWPDADAWATIAQGWDAGVRPYRDVTIFNFPGQIELCWVIGKVFGWGRTWPFYAVDAGLLIAFGGLLGIWSRRRFGLALPGLIGWAAAAWMYMGLNYTMVAQRDWQGPLLAVSSLVVVQAWTGRAGSITSAALMAMAFAIRPHVVLFLPAVALAIACDAGSWRFILRKGIAWGLAFGLFAALIFSPLIAQGLLGDLARGVRQASYGSGYGGVTRRRFAAELLRQLGLIVPGDNVKVEDRAWVVLTGWKVLATIAALGGIVAASSPARRRLITPWLAVLLLVLLYAPMHPKRHAYLVLPLRLAWATCLGVVAGVVLDRLSGMHRGVRITALVIFLALAMPGIPEYCKPAEAIAAIQGRATDHVPATARDRFAPGNHDTRYRWDDYQDLLAYLRDRTTPETRVANVLRNIPFPAINGVVGRVSPLPAESGVIWLWSVNPKLEGAFVEAIRSAPAGSVVVWSPNETPFTELLNLDALCAAIRRFYRFEARFGAYEVWRKS